MNSGVPSFRVAAFNFSFSKEPSSFSSPTLNSVAIVPTNTSRAANEVTSAIPILQSKPSGAIAGSSCFPITPANEFSSLAAWYSLVR